jgi:chromate transporter
MASTLPSPTLGDLFWNFCRVAARGFGGAMPWARQMLVEERAWLTPQEFMDVLSLCQLLPGPNVINVSVVVGSRFRGAPGAVVAALGRLALPFVVVLVLGGLYTRVGQVPAAEALLRGVGPAAAGLVIATGLKMAAPMARVPRVLGFLLAVFAAVALLRWPLVPVLLGIAPLSVLVAWARRR